MSRLSEAFDKAAAEQRASLIIYLCAGDPSLDESRELLLAAVNAGADILEVGVPFSDPTADGPSIQRASERSLAAGTTLDSSLGMIGQLRQHTDVPIVLFGYYNPILAYGEQRLAEKARQCGVDGVLVVDLPPEDSAVLRDPLQAAGIDYVPLLAPTSTPDREAAVTQAATSFIYYVSLTGVTGAKAVGLKEASQRAGALSKRTGKPVALGFGIKSGADAALVREHANGVVVGSAVVDAVAAAASKEARVEAVRRLVSELAEGVRGAEKAATRSL